MCLLRATSTACRTRPPRLCCRHGGCKCRSCCQPLPSIPFQLHHCASALAASPLLNNDIHCVTAHGGAVGTAHGSPATGLQAAVQAAEGRNYPLVCCRELACEQLSANRIVCRQNEQPVAADVACRQRPQEERAGTRRVSLATFLPASPLPKTRPGSAPRLPNSSSRDARNMANLTLPFIAVWLVTLAGKDVLGAGRVRGGRVRAGRSVPFAATLC